MAWAAIRRGRMSDRASRTRLLRQARTLEPRHRGLGFLGWEANWPGLVMAALGGLRLWPRSFDPRIDPLCPVPTAVARINLRLHHALFSFHLPLAPTRAKNSYESQCKLSQTTSSTPEVGGGGRSPSDHPPSLASRGPPPQRPPPQLHRLARRLPRPRARAGHPAAGLRRRLPRRRRQRRGGAARQPQAEFTKPIWEYLDGAASPTRGRDRPGQARQLDPTLAAIESRYGVDRGAVLAIWGMESNYGGNRGSIPVIESLATLAYEGRRRELRRGAADRRAPHPAVRRRRSRPHGRLLGRRHGPHPVHADELPRWPSTSTATGGATSGRRPDRRARLGGELPRHGPAGSAAGPGASRCACRRASTTARPTSRTAARSRTGARGVTLARRRGAARPRPAAIIAPAGARGPAFAVYQNFFVIKKYNNATSYAMGVGHLGDRIMGGGPSPAPGRAASASSRAPRRSSCRSG